MSIGGIYKRLGKPYSLIKFSSYAQVTLVEAMVVVVVVVAAATVTLETTTPSSQILDP